MNCEKCGEVCGCPMEPPAPALSMKDAAPGNLPDPGAGPGQDGADDSAWRDELSARLNRYRARRKAPPPRYPSLRLPFDAIGSQTKPVEAPMAPVFETTANHALALDTTQHEPAVEETPATIPTELPADSALPGARRMGSQVSAKIIEFPRFAWAPPPPPPDQLAEPVMDRPRILEVPEVVPPPPALGGITIEPAQVAEPEKVPGLDIPLQSAPLGRRMVAAFVDGILVAGAAALFACIFWKVTAVAATRVQIAGFAAAASCLFWVTYQYLLIVYGASSPGLRVARLRLTRFDGSPTSRSLRRWRVLASYLSAASLGMGYAWVFLDEDALCWHDRITHTYLAPVNSGKRA